MSRADLLEVIASKAREVRTAQRVYFEASRTNSFKGGELQTARRLERELDRLLEQLDAPQRSLFEGDS